ncbi:hypothetical protein [Zobellella maritima]|uniref:hypothetical protein n=1 Tax=Zobellella maritima TaxID=2059725 RepID=UPI000E3075C3|nr:hypothetical protein [Zobellella maritima]
MKIKIRKGMLTLSLLAVLWLPLLGVAATIDKHADKPVWMDWTFFGNTVITATLSRWSSRND